MQAREIIFTIFIAIALPLVALLSIFWMKQPSVAPAPQPGSAFPYVAPVNIVAQADQKAEAQKSEGQAASASSQTAANSEESSAEKLSGAGILSAAAGAIQKTTESWQDFLVRFYASPASLPATSPLGDLYVGGVTSPDPFPLRNWQVPLTDIDGWSVISTQLPDDKILYEKDIFTPHSIASLSKLMTALVVVNHLDLSQEVVVSQNAVDTEGDEGGLVVGEVLTVKQLLYAMLLTSSNDAAVALEEDYNHHAQKGDSFVAEMNKEAQTLGFSSMSFQDPTGLTPQNVSDAEDVAKLMFVDYQNATLKTILGSGQYDTQSKEGAKHHWVSTDSLLGQIPGVVAGKTGFINEAGQCLVVVTLTNNQENPKMIVSVILGSSNRMQAMATLLSWIQSAYSWQ